VTQGTNTPQTLNVTDNSIGKATASYSKKGIKTVTVTFKSSTNALLATDTLNITIGNDNSLPTVRITGVVSNSQYVPSEGKADSETVLVRGSYIGTWDAGYSIKVYDGSTYLGDAKVNPKNNTWTYTTGTLDGRVHEFKAVVVNSSDATVKVTDSNVYSVSVGTCTTSTKKYQEFERRRGYPLENKHTH
jgi:hypothetical protein